MLSPATAAGLDARFYFTSATPPTVRIRFRCRQDSGSERLARHQCRTCRAFDIHQQHVAADFARPFQAPGSRGHRHPLASKRSLEMWFLSRV